MPAFDDRIAAGFLYGDWQFAIDPASADFLSRGVFSCYRPVDAATPISETPKELTIDDWRNLMYLAHTDKKKAWELYSGHYLATSGQIYWSDRMQQSIYIDDYHRELDPELSGGKPATEMISEIYVPRPALAAFLAEVRTDFRANAVNLIYGTVRLIERDDESFLAWATQPWACVIFNLHVAHDEPSLAKAADGFPPPDRPRPPARRQLLSHLPPLGEPGRGGGGLSQLPRIPAAQAAVRPRGALPERLVSSISRSVLLGSMIPAARWRQIRNAVIPITLLRQAPA